MGYSTVGTWLVTTLSGGDWSWVVKTPSLV